ncbi:HAAS signaling domain-containing protein, partial [Crossiella equi]
MKVAEDWLARYDRAAAVLPQPRRTELREELVEHLEALRAEGVGEEEIVSRLGDPAEIVAAEGVPALTPQRELAAKALFLLPLTGVLFLIPSMPPGLLTMTVLVLASVTTLVLVLRSGAGAGARVLGATGALAPPLAGLGGILDKVFQFRQTTHDLPLDGGRFHQVVWATDPWTTALGQFAMLLLGLGLPVLAGLRLRRPDTAPLPGLTAAALLLTPCVGLAAALMLSGAALDGPVNEVVRTPMLVVALVVAAVLLAAGALAAARPGLPTLTKVLVVAAVLCAPVGVSMLAQ